MQTLGKTGLDFDARHLPTIPSCPKSKILRLRRFFLQPRGTVANHVGLAKRAAVSTVRISQIMKLRSLAPALQERILHIEGEAWLSESTLRKIAEEIDWERQTAMFEAAVK